jgi:hypothetical protein
MCVFISVKIELYIQVVENNLPNLELIYSRFRYLLMLLHYPFVAIYYAWGIFDARKFQFSGTKISALYPNKCNFDGIISRMISIIKKASKKNGRNTEY